MFPGEIVPIQERIVYNDLDPCPYIEGELSCMPLRRQYQMLSPEEFDFSLANGDRRVGQMLYRTECPFCTACEPIRIPVQQFIRSKSQRKVWNKGHEIKVEEGNPISTHEKLLLYNRHKQERNLAQNDTFMGEEGYNGWFVRTCTKTKEFRYIYKNKLVGISILDFGSQDISSVYFFFDPDVEHLSLGTYSVLYEIDWMKQRNLRFYYLGLYVESCIHLNYKGKYFPHHRRVLGDWKTFHKKEVL